MRRIALLAAALALGAPGAALATTYIHRCLPDECTVPVADGVVNDLEYADGVGYPLSNFAGGADGAMRLQLTGDRLTIGLRLPRPSGDAAKRGAIDLFLDADRPGTACVATAEIPGPEDRTLRVQYDLTSGTASASQRVGTAAGWQPPGGPNWFLKLWPTTVALTRPTADSLVFHVELTVVLRPMGAATSQVIADGRVGLAMVHTLADVAGHMPGGATAPPDGLAPCSWETLDFRNPVGIPLALTVWEQRPFETPLLVHPDPDQVAEAIWSRDVVCLTEVGDDGAQQEIIRKANQRRVGAGLEPFTPVTVSWEFDQPDVPDYEYSLILSSKPVIATRSSPHNQVWARLLTRAAAPAVKGAGWDAGEFIDVYCGAATSDLAVHWFADLIEDTRATDRPAFALIHNPGGFPNTLGLLGVDEPSAFDQANTWLDDTYDLNVLPGGLGAKDATHILALPATDPWPAYGIEVQPTVSNQVPRDEDGRPVTGFAEETATASLVRTDQPGHWNPMKKHRLTYEIATLEDHASGGCCADWFTPFIGFHNGPSWEFLPSSTPDGDVVHPGWWASMDIESGTATATVEVWEYDSGSSDDHYDVVPGGDSDPFFRFTHMSGLVERITSSGQVAETLGTFEDHPGGLATSTTGNTGEIGTAFHVVTAEEID